MNDDWKDNQDDDEEEFILEIDPYNSLLIILTDLAYDAARSVLCWGIWQLALVKWFTFLPMLTYWQIFLIVLFFDILLAGRFNG